MVWQKISVCLGQVQQLARCSHCRIQVGGQMLLLQLQVVIEPWVPSCARGCLRKSGAGRNRMQILSDLTLYSNCPLGVKWESSKYSETSLKIQCHHRATHYFLSNIINLVFCISFLVYRFLKL